MSPIKRLLLGMTLLIGVLFGVAFALPREISISRSTIIDAPESDVFPYVNNFRKFNLWSPWAARDPEATYAFSGPPEGKGARMEWASDHPEVGVGSQEIVESERNALVKVELEFGDMGPATASYRLSPSGAGTKVTWSFQTDVGNNPLMRWAGLLFVRWIGTDFDAGLARLKKTAESGAS